MHLIQVNLFVEDFPKVLRFYRDVLGLRASDVDPGPPSIPMVNWASLAAGEVSIELFDAKIFWDPSLLQRTNRDAVQLCFRVDSVGHERERLVDAGVECQPVVSEEWGRYSAFRDPEGNWLQIFEIRDRGSDPAA